jgi:hypothetical protein
VCPAATDARSELLLTAISNPHLLSFRYDYPLCATAMKLMIRAYGTEAGNLALQFLPFGGLYITQAIILKVCASLSPRMYALALPWAPSHCLLDGRERNLIESSSECVQAATAVDILLALPF